MAESSNDSGDGLIRSGSAVLVATAISAAIGIVTIAVLTRITSPDTLGRYFLFIALLGIAAIPTDIGLNGAVEKRISEGQATESVFWTGILLKQMSFLIVALVLVLASSWINEYVGAAITSYLILALWTREMNRTITRGLRGNFRMGWFSILKVVRRGTWAVGGVVAIARGGGFESLIFALVAGQAAVIVLGFAVLRPPLAAPDLGTVRSLLTYARFNSLTSVGGYVYNWMDTAMLGLFVNPGLVAAYEVAWRVTKIGPMFILSFTTTMFPKLSEWINDGERNKAGRVVSSSLIPSYALMIPIVVGTVALSEELLRVVYSPDYVVASGALIVLVLGRVLWTTEATFSRALHAADRPGLSARTLIVAVALNIVLNVILIPRLGLTGAAISTSVSYGVKGVVDYVIFNKIIRTHIPRAQLGWALGSALVMGVAVEALSTFVGSSLLILALIIGSGAVVYFALLGLQSDVRRRLFDTLSSG